VSTPGTTRFRKKPVTIEAMQYPGVREWAEAAKVFDWLDEHGVKHRHTNDGLMIQTLEGDMLARPGWWIICGVEGEFYPCAPEIFEASYEVAEGAGPTVPELLEVLEGAVDCAIWLTGLGEIPADSAWPEMREKLHRALPYVKATIESDGEVVGFVP
jgi:hypothetical protein